MTPHTLRHTAASWMLNHDVPLDVIAQYLGHKDARTTASIYAHPDVDRLEHAANVVDLKVVRGR